MTERFTTRALEPAEYPDWEKFVAESPDGSIYSLPSYLEVLCAATGARYRILAVFRDGVIVGGVALYVSSSPVGNYVAPRFLLYYNGLVLARSSSKYPSQRTSLSLHIMDALESALQKEGYAHLRLHSRATISDVRPFLAKGWSARPSFSYVVDLSDIESARNRIERNFRRLIKRCEQDGIVMSQDDDFESFFALHDEIHRRKGVPLYLREPRYREYYLKLRERSLCKLFHARLPQGQSIASQLVLLGPHPISHTVCAGAAEEYLKTGASVFLRWKACEALAADGYEGNDLTDAELNPVTRFKSQLGAELKLSFMLHRQDAVGWRVRNAALRPFNFSRRALRAVQRRIASRGA
ncbi:MAG TPA: GNAT family N-acetyltransferase [Candidatus Krumholzibacteria bacterium]|nr:GNAT family N-acetyltransferase [Candidatus Krumholzibacteria bacterium]